LGVSAELDADLLLEHPEVAAEQSQRREGGLFTTISIIGQGVFLIVVKKRAGMGITTVILGATVLGFGLHVSLRTLQL
jgi:hypothetical protein